MAGVEVDEHKQPLKAWGDSSHPDYESGARAAYFGLSRRTQKHSAQWKAGYKAQCELLPKRSGSRSGKAIAWHRCLYRKGQTGWVMGSNW